MRFFCLLVCTAIILPIPAMAKPSADAKRARELEVKNTVDRIRKDCGITSGQFSYSAEKISLNYDGMIEPEKLDCANDRAILLGIDFDSYDSTAPYSGPRRFLIKGPPKRLDIIAAEAASARWTITHRADAPDGIAFLEVETGPDFTRREVRSFLERFIFGDLGDVAVGLTPTNIAGHDLPSTAAAFRSDARHMYDRLNTRSCGTPSGFDREAMLKPDRDAVASLEQLLSATGSGAHLAIARADAAYELSKKPDSCWADDDLRFAKIHVDMVHKSVTSGITRLKQLAPALDPLPASPAPANAVEFRYEVRQLVERTLPLCSWTSKGSNEAIFAATLAELKLFEDRLRGTPYALHYAVAKEDAAYDRSQVTAECDDPGSDPVSKLSAEMLASAKRQIGQIEGLTAR